MAGSEGRRFTSFRLEVGDVGGVGGFFRKREAREDEVFTDLDEEGESSVVKDSGGSFGGDAGMTTDLRSFLGRGETGRGTVDAEGKGTSAG